MVIPSGSYYTTIGLLALAIFWLITGWITAVLGLHSYQDVLNLQEIVYHDREFQQFNINLNQKNFTMLKVFYFSFFGITTLLLGWAVFRLKEAKEEIREFRREFFALWRTLICTLQHLSPQEKAIGAVLFLLLFSVRTYLFVTFPDYVDEITSFHYFVSESSLSVIGFYPMPNNHILSNLLCRLVYYFTSDFGLIMRLPTFIFSTFGIVILYAAALRYSNFTVATIGTSLFWFTEFGLFYSIAGRGYYIFFFCAGLLFILTYSLVSTKDFHRIKWAGWVLLGIAGFYTMPPFFYPFFSACVVCFVWYLASKNKAGIGMLFCSGGLVSISCLVLYLPVIAISGISALTANSYVKSLSQAEFWSGFGGFAYNIERKITGLNVVGFIILLLSIALFFAFTRKWKHSLKFSFFGYLALAFAFLPYLILTVQQVYPPVRVLFYKSFYMHLLLGIVTSAIMYKYKTSASKRSFIVLLLCLLSAAPQTIKFINRTLVYEKYEQNLQRKYALLMQKNPKLVLLNDDFHEIYFSHYAQQQNHQVTFHSNRQKVPYDAVLMDTTDAVPRWP